MLDTVAVDIKAAGYTCVGVVVDEGGAGVIVTLSVTTWLEVDSGFYS